MKKRILAVCLVICILFTSIGSSPALALPAPDSLVMQLGGPISITDPTDMDSLMQKYASNRAYEVRFYPFGKVSGGIVFRGTAHYVRDLHKTDLEIAYYEAMRKSGTDERSLKTFYEYAAKYEANATFSAEDMAAILIDAAANTGTAVSLLEHEESVIMSDPPKPPSDKPDGLSPGSTVISATGIVIGTAGVMYDITGQGQVTANTVVSGAFTLYDIASLIGEAGGSKALSALGGVAAAGSIAWNTYWKYVEHQAAWKEFTEYIIGRRNLVEFFKWLEAELGEAMKATTGWDIQFNEAKAKTTVTYLSAETPIEATMNARFMHNYVPEFAETDLTATNPDGWLGQMEIYFEADMTQFQLSFPGSVFDITGIAEEWQPYCNRIIKNDTSFSDFYWNATLSSKTLPLKAGSMSMDQPKISFTGSLAGESYEYRQGGEYIRDFLGCYELSAEDFYERIDYEVWGKYVLDQEGHRHHYKINNAVVAPHSMVLMADEGINSPEEGDFFTYDMSFDYSTALMEIDLTRPLGQENVR